VSTRIKYSIWPHLLQIVLERKNIKKKIISIILVVFVLDFVENHFIKKIIFNFKIKNYSYKHFKVYFFQKKTKNLSV
jgi:uncharacterized protein (UPF0332 family)